MLVMKQLLIVTKPGATQPNNGFAGCGGPRRLQLVNRNPRFRRHPREVMQLVNEAPRTNQNPCFKTDDRRLYDSVHL